MIDMNSILSFSPDRLVQIMKIEYFEANGEIQARYA